MSDRFIYENVYETQTWTVKYDEGSGYRDKFYQLVKQEIESSAFPNIEVTEAEYVTGGLFFGKESTPMVRMAPVKSQFKKFEIFYRAQEFGNTVVFSCLECMQLGFFDIAAGKNGYDIHKQLQAKCKNLAEWEEFVAIDSLANIVFDNALMDLDPNYQYRLRTSKSGDQIKKAA